jgi:uncharacterized membrane protein HdeD (DUF308 family)
MAPDSTAASPATPEDGTPSLLDRNWRWLVLRGVLALIVAVLAFVFPLTAIFAFTLIFAVYCLVDGVVSLIAGVRGARHKEERWGALILRGVLGILIAAAFVLMPLIVAIGYAFGILAVLVVWAILTGVLEITAAIRLRKEIKGEWLLALSGILSILLGIAIWAMLLLNPVVTLVSVGGVIGAWAALAGITLITLGMRLRRRQLARSAR